MAISSGERGTKSQQQDRRNAADRDRSVSGGGSGERGTRSQQQDRRNIDTARRAGNSAPGVRGDAISDAERRARQQYVESMRAAPVPQANLAGPHGYGAAVDRYRTEHPEGELDRWDILDFLGGAWLDANPPNVTKPGSFVGGNWHTSTNVPGVIGGLLGGAFAGPLGGTIGSQVARYGADLAGIPGDIYHGGIGYSTDAPTGLTSPNAGSTPPSMAGHGGDGLLSPNFGVPTTPTTPTTAQTAAAAPRALAVRPQAPGDLYKTLQAQYMPVNARGLAEYGVWRPEHRFAA